MTREKKDVVQFRWAVEGQPDPFADYLDRPREDLPLADLSDDELANYAFMNYDRGQNEEVAVMMAMGNDGHYPKIAFMTAVKERIRWLSRQLAIAQGTYPGKEPKSILSTPIADLEGMVSLLGEDTSASNALFGQKPLSESDYFHNMQRELSNRKGSLLWEHNVEHFLKHFRAKRDDINEPLRRETFVKTLIGMFPLVNKENIRAALTIDIGLHNGAAYRWDSYVRLCQDLMAEYKVYIPFDGDIVADGRLGNGFNVIAKSKYHCSGQAVQYPVGVIEDYITVQRKMLVAYGDSPTAAMERRMHGHSVEGDDAIIRDGKTARRIPTGFEVETKPAVALTEQEIKNAHSYWFKEVGELYTLVGVNPMFANLNQAASRITRLTKKVSSALVIDALGGTTKYEDRLCALRQVRKAVDEGIAESQARVVEQFGEQAVRDAEDLTKVPAHRLGPNENYYKTVVIKDPELPKKKDE